MGFFKKLQEHATDVLATGTSAALLFAGTSLVAGPVVGAVGLATAGVLCAALVTQDHSPLQDEGSSQLGKALTKEFCKQAGIKHVCFSESDGSYGMASTTNGRICISSDVVNTAPLANVAMLVGHEVGHFIHHTAQASVDTMSKLNLIATGLLSTVSLAFGNFAAIPLLVASGTAGLLLGKIHQRGIELRCDRHGMQLAGTNAARACAQERERIVEKGSILRDVQNRFGKNTLAYSLLGLLDDHPNLEQRLRFIDRFEAQQEPDFTRRREIELHLQFGGLALARHLTTEHTAQPAKARPERARRAMPA